MALSQPARQTEADPVATAFLASLGNANHQTYPYDFWLLEDTLPPGVCEDIADLPFPPPNDPVFDGTRECNNAQREYFTPENQAKFDVCCRVVDGFESPAFRATIESVSSADLSDGLLRIEYCQ